MSDTLRFRLGNLVENDVIQVNLIYVKVIKDFNIYAEAAKMRYYYPDISWDDFSSYLVKRTLGYLIMEEKDQISYLSLDEENKIVVKEGPFPIKEHPFPEIDEHNCSYMIDRFTPPQGAMEVLHQTYPLMAEYVSSQVFAFTASYLDTHLHKHEVTRFLDNLDKDSHEEDILDFIKHVESLYAKRRIQYQIDTKGYTVLGRGPFEGNPAVFYTLGLYDTKVGRDLLLTTQDTNPELIVVFKKAAQLLFENKTIDEVNDGIKEHKCRISIRNLKTYPKGAFEFADAELPVLGVLTLIH